MLRLADELYPYGKERRVQTRRIEILARPNNSSSRRR